MEETKIIDQIKIKIDEQEVLRYLGYQKELLCDISPDITQIVRQEIAGIYSLLENKGIYRLLAVKSISEDGVISVEQGFHFLMNKKVIGLLKNAQYLFLTVVTIGSETEKVIQERFKKNEYVRAMVLDSAGTVAVKTVGQWLNHFLEQKSLQEGYQLSRYFEPGCGDWDIREQKRVFQVLKPEKIGITLNPFFMMNPAKSLSSIRGMGQELVDSYRNEFSCDYCLLDHCPFRKK